VERINSHGYINLHRCGDTLREIQGTEPRNREMIAVYVTLLAVIIVSTVICCYVKRDVYTSSIFEMVQCGVGLATLRAVT